MLACLCFQSGTPQLREFEERFALSLILAAAPGLPCPDLQRRLPIYVFSDPSSPILKHSKHPSLISKFGSYYSSSFELKRIASASRLSSSESA
jgi:hypothetical protein